MVVLIFILRWLWRGLRAKLWIHFGFVYYIINKLAILLLYFKSFGMAGWMTFTFQFPQIPHSTFWSLVTLTLCASNFHHTHKIQLDNVAFPLVVKIRWPVAVWYHLLCLEMGHLQNVFDGPNFLKTCILNSGLLPTYKCHPAFTSLLSHLHTWKMLNCHALLYQINANF